MNSIRLSESRRTFIRKLLATGAVGLSLSTFCEGAEAVVRKGKSLPGLDAFDTLMQRFFEENQPLGASLAVGYRGRLVYAKGFGYADPEKKEEVQPTSLFRIASLSKPITATAVMKLVERGVVKLDDPIVPALKLSFLDADPQKWADPRFAQITVRQCLQHTGGFDKDASGDPLAMSHQIRKALDVEFPLSQEDVLKFALSRPLDFEPGTKYAYANLGYLMLGRLIEQITSQPYDAYVKEQILTSLGIQRMRLAKTLPPDRAEGEVTYVNAMGRVGPNVMGLESSEYVPYPYGIERIENLAPVGGWLASSVDMVRFASGLFFPGTRPLLSRKTLETMLAPPRIPGKKLAQGDAYYACGWQVRAAREKVLPWTAWHTGALAGVSTLLVSRADGVSWAVLFNKDYAPDASRLSGKIDSQLHAPASGVKPWPSGNLFPRFL